MNSGYCSKLSSWSLESMEPISSRMPVGVSRFSMTRTLAPSSAAVMVAIQPPVPQPTTRTSVSSSSLMSASLISGLVPSQSALKVSAASCTTTALPLAWEMQSATAFLTASVVTVAPETASTSTPCASRMACSSTGAALPPSSGVSPEASILTLRISLSLNSMVTLTSLAMPLAEAEYVPGV